MRAATMFSVAVLAVSASAFAQTTSRPGSGTVSNNTISNNAALNNTADRSAGLPMPDNTVANSTRP